MFCSDECMAIGSHMAPGPLYALPCDGKIQEDQNKSLLTHSLTCLPGCQTFRSLTFP